MKTNFDEMRADPQGYWERRYKTGSPHSSGRPGTALRRFVEPLAAGRALELGCGKGDDAVWLAGAGWSVVAVEIAAAAIELAAANAARAGVADRIRFEQHDLSRAFPDGTFDLVVASFLAAFPREEVLRRAAGSVAPGGHLLIIEHGSRPPWSTAPDDWRFPVAAETVEALALEEGAWRPVHVGSLEREMTGPEGERASVLDTVVFLRRL
ncbi:class I SAM-dependent methyltransferase [Acuticoccus kandeliae]|uniref:class I SAM-dependent methyltransferase n=1 Tax=Acuticoccus kandeliae TaxID=2073160 RepID=UPI001FEA2FE2|nr:methyltransferase domain-containing protein [Acuticoccus kandeliae]